MPCAKLLFFLGLMLRDYVCECLHENVFLKESSHHISRQPHHHHSRIEQQQQPSSDTPANQPGIQLTNRSDRPIDDHRQTRPDHHQQRAVHLIICIQSGRSVGRCDERWTDGRSVGIESRRISVENRARFSVVARVILVGVVVVGVK